MGSSSLHAVVYLGVRLSNFVCHASLIPDMENRDLYLVTVPRKVGSNTSSQET